MKKILILFSALVFVSCSGDDDLIDSSEIIGTYSFVFGCETNCDDEQFRWYGCSNDFIEFSTSLFSNGFIDGDDCSNTNYFIEFSVSYEVIKTGSQKIHGKLNFNESYPEENYGYFTYDISDKRLILHTTFVGDPDPPSESYWDIKEIWQKN